MPEIVDNAAADKIIQSAPIEKEELMGNSENNCCDNLDNSNSSTEEQLLKRKPINFRTEILKGVHSPSDVLSPFSQKISSERNSALKNFKPKSLLDKLMGVKSTSQLSESGENKNTSSLESKSSRLTPNHQSESEEESPEEE